MRLNGEAPSPVSMVKEAYRWVDERSGLHGLVTGFFLRHIPFGVGWRYTVGFATLFVLINQFVTGVLLSLYYSPTPDHAYASVQFIMTEVMLGSVIRGLHHWGSSAMVALTFFHMAVVFVLGAYKYPRELTWVIGVLLLLVVIGLGFTGYLLPWDEKAYWATTVGTNMTGTAPYIGGFLLKVVRGGSELGAVTLTRFYSLHIVILPMFLLILTALHMYLVVRQGVSVPPELWEERQRKAAGKRSNGKEGAP